MNLSSFNIKIIIGTTYLAILLIGLFFLFSIIDVKELMSYEFIRENRELIIKYKYGYQKEYS